MDLVELVSPDGRGIGTAPKLDAHSPPGRLHRAVSVVVVDSAGRVLLQRRAAAKYHFARRWANSCCTHPAPGQVPVAAAERRLAEEMGLICRLTEVGTVVYRADDPGSGLVEYELDHIMVGTSDFDPDPDPAEVEDWRWTSPAELGKALTDSPADYAPWLGPVIDRALAGP